MVETHVSLDVTTGVALLCRRGDHAVLREATLWLHETCRRYGVPADATGRLDFCLNELMANIIDHGYLDEDTHTVSISCDFTTHATVLRIRDDGVQFDAAGTDGYIQPASLQEAGTRGYGLHLVHSFADGMRHTYNEGWNTVELHIAHATSH